MLSSTTTLNYEKQKLINLLAAYGIHEPILTAFDDIPKEQFMLPQYILETYQDRALPIGENQTISQPSLLALTLQELKLKGDEKILEIGTGSGFFAALLAKVAREVYTIERIEKFAKTAEKRFKNLQLKNIKVTTGDGTKGWPENAPYDVIIVSAAFKDVPEPLITQLKDGGKLVMPIGDNSGQELVLFKKEGGKLSKIKSIGAVRFVQLIGEHGWKDAGRQS